ncbi:MAG: MFS transporter, partial [bacterium]
MPKLLSHQSFDVLRLSEFRGYIVARFFFILVLNMQATLISWKVYEITKDPFSIGLIGLIEFVPAVIMAFFAGHIIDLSDKRKMMLAAMAANVVLTLTLTGITSNFSLQTFT